jgi:hypothetical protein
MIPSENEFARSVKPPGIRFLAVVLRGCNRRQITTTNDCDASLSRGPGPVKDAVCGRNQDTML